MKAIGVTEFGGPEALNVLELPRPGLREGEVLIRVQAAAVNPTDVTLRSGANAKALRAASPGPWVPGMDVAGEVAQVSDEVDDLHIGQRVAAVVVPDKSYGGYSEMIAVPRASVVTIPEHLTLQEAAALPMNGLTATVILSTADLARGQSLLVTGAAGVLGSYLVSLACRRGLRVIAEGRPGDREFLLELGADVVVDRSGDLTEQMRTLAPCGVDALADLANHGLSISGLIRRGGAFIGVRGATGEAAVGVRVHPISVRDHVGDVALMRQLQDAILSGDLRPRVGQVFPAELAADAHRAHEQPGRRGRVVLSF